MAGYSRLYCVGELGGFQGADGINPIWCQIWVGDADRQWWEAHYIHDSIEPLGDITVVVPSEPDGPNALIDSCLAFLPQVFDRCPSMPTVRQQAAGLTRLDFSLGRDEIPSDWAQLREEARQPFTELHIFEARLRELDLGG